MRYALAGSLLLCSMTLGSLAFAQEAPPPPPPAPAPPSPPAPPPPAPEPPPPPQEWHHVPGPGMGPGPGGMGPGPHHMGPHDPVQRVQVTVESENPEKNVVLERRIKVDEMYGKILFVIPEHTDTQSWEQVCVAPCKVDLDRSSTYRIGKGNMVTRSGQFTLPPGSDQVKLQVHPGNITWHGAATRVTATGIAAAIVGAALITTASTWDDKDDEKDVRKAGIITGAIGLGLLAIGIPIAILTQTHVTANEKKVAKAPPAPKLTLGGLTF